MELEERVIRDYYEEFTRKHWEKIIRKLDVDEDTFNEVISEITKLNPRPGASLGETIGRNFQQIIPDFIVETYDDGTINVSLNNRNVPELRMSVTSRKWWKNILKISSTRQRNQKKP